MKRRFSITLLLFAITIIAIFLLFLAPEPAHAAFGPFNPLPKQIVPECNITQRTGDQISGLDPKTICTFCDFLKLIQNILNYTWWLITPVVIVIALVWGGALMFISSTQGNVTQAQRGKKIIFNTLIGFVLVFGAWLIIDTVIKVLGGRIGSNTAVSPFGPWNEITCVAPTVSTTLPPPLPPPIPPEVITTTGSAAICNKIRSNSRIDLTEPGDCRELLSGEKVGAKRTIDDCADSKPPIVCEAGCKDKAVCKRQSSVTVNPKMLAAIDSVGQTTSFKVTSITTGAHSPTSNHYVGNAVDVIPPQRTTEGYESLRQKFQSAGGSALCEAKSGKTYQNCTTSFPSTETINHIHVNF